MRAIVVVLVAGCGRVGFASLGATDAGAPTDGPADGSSRPLVGYVQGITQDAVSQSSITATLPDPPESGDQLVVSVGWTDATTSIMTISDTAGAMFTAIAPVTRAPSVSQVMFHAAAVPIANDTVTVTFNGVVSSASLRVAVYAGTDLAAAIPYTASPGTGLTGITGPVQVNLPGTTLVASDTVRSTTSTADPAFTPRLTTQSGDLVEDLDVETMGPYYVTSTFAASTDYVLELVGLVPL